MECMYCKGKMLRAKAPFQMDRKGYHVTFEAVAAWVCSQCGEVYFDEEGVEAIQEALQTLDRQSERLAKVS
jgi:YgiT-type zinc finger domain-containing protein